MKMISVKKISIVSMTFILFSFLFTQSNYSQQAFKKRTWFKARFEPKSRVISGAGQSDDAFDSYIAAVGEKNRPVIYMSYVGMKDTNFEKYFNSLSEKFAKYPWQLIPQIGVSMTRDGSPEQHYEQDVASGKYDDKIESLCKGLKAYGKPVFLRIGYEFSGHWNGYQPDTYILAWKRITAAFRKNGVTNVATVWCMSADANNKDFMEFYPGDSEVDWWGVDIFGIQHFTDPVNKRFLELSLKHKKPVMIGESTPHKVGVLEGEKSWNTWFKPYFELINNTPNIKAISYINWDWSKYEMWKDWGDGRIESNEFVKKAFVSEMGSKLYLHGGKVLK